MVGNNSSGDDPMSEDPLQIDSEQDERATQLGCTCAAFSRPHFRALVCSWWGLFVSFFVWYALPSLLSQIRVSLDLTRDQVWTSSVVAICGTIVSRILLGFLCDRGGGPRLWMMIILVFTSITAAMTGLVRDYPGLATLRFFIGFAGGIFVISQHWISLMYAKNIIGTATALVTGWGAIGGCLSERLMENSLIPGFIEFYKDVGNPEEFTWRAVSVVPAVVALISGMVIYFISKDTPKGNYADLKQCKNGSLNQIFIKNYINQAVTTSHASLILFIQFACCYGVDLNMKNASALFMADEHGVTYEEGASFVSNSCFLNLLAPLLGGMLSDVANSKHGLRGRIMLQHRLLLVESIFVFMFTTTRSLTSAKAVYFLFRGFSKAAQASTFAMVPYVCIPATGLVMGFVGAGGSLGFLCFSLAFREMDYLPAFYVMGILTMVSSLLSVLLSIQGHRPCLFFCNKDRPDEQATPDDDQSANDNDDDDDDDDQEKEVLPAAEIDDDGHYCSATEPNEEEEETQV